MYYNDYDDYMRNVLGYSNEGDNTYARYSDNCYGMNYSDIGYNNMYNSVITPSNGVEQMYPEIYKVINPMVCQMCDKNTQPVTEYLIEQMTDDIYDNVVNRVEIQNVINLNIGTRNSDIQINEKSEEVENRTSTARTTRNDSTGISNNNSKNSLSGKSINPIQANEATERETRSPRKNGLLRDLIRILILNRFLRPNRPHRPHRPGVRPGPGPRPHPGMPGQYIPRPPMPRDDDGYLPYM